MTTEKNQVVLIEDDPGHAEILKLCFSELDLPVRLRHFLTGEEALEHLRARHGQEDDAPPRLVILDLRLPRMDGISVLETIRADRRFGDLPVVILSTSSMHSEVKRAYKSGVNDFLVKPFDLQEYMVMVRKFADDWLD